MGVRIASIEVSLVDWLEQYQSFEAIGSEQFNAHLSVEHVLGLIKGNELLEKLSVFFIDQAMFNFLDTFLEILVRWYEHGCIVSEDPA